MSGAAANRLTPAAKRQLVEIARQAIADGPLESARPPEPSDSALLRTEGAFVTIRIDGALRGCIGTFAPSGPLYQTVANMARSAAFDDPRFPPLRPEECAGIDVEISVLTPLEKIKDPSMVEVGRHGLYMARGPFRGVLLPQVATDYGWDRERFLEETSRKAGLPRDGWKTAELFVFEAEVFGEREEDS